VYSPATWLSPTLNDLIEIGRSVEVVDPSNEPYVLVWMQAATEKKK
jgi:hypothetical protein